MNPSDNPQKPTDVNQQYQDILNKYAEDIKKLTQDYPAPETPTSTPVTEPEPVAAITSVEPPTAMDTLVQNTPPAQPSVLDDLVQDPTLSTLSPEPELSLPPQATPTPPSPVMVAPAPEPMPSVTPSTPEPTTPITPPPIVPPAPPAFVIDEPPQKTPPSGPNLFKYLFFLSFLIFMGVTGAIVYTLFFSPPTNNKTGPMPTVSVSPTTNPEALCQLNDKTYKVGESFKAADGCNTCSCNSDLTINCTLMACDVTASPSAKPSTSATTSAIPKDWKTFSSTKWGFSLKYPKDWSVVEKSGVLTISDGQKNENAIGISFTPIDEPKDDFLKRLAVKDVAVDNSDASFKEINLGGEKAYNLELATAMGSQQDHVYFSAKKVSLEIIRTVFADKSANERVDQILSTFKLL